MHVFCQQSYFYTAWSHRHRKQRCSGCLVHPYKITSLSLHDSILLQWTEFNVLGALLLKMTSESIYAMSVSLCIINYTEYMFVTTKINVSYDIVLALSQSPFRGLGIVEATKVSTCIIFQQCLDQTSCIMTKHNS